MSFANKVQKEDEPREPADLLLKKIDAIPLYKVREYVAQREEKEFFTRLEEMKAADHSVILDLRQMDEQASRNITLFVDPNHMESIPEAQRREELQKLWETGRRILAKQGIAIHESQVIMNDKNPGSVSDDDKRWQLQFDVDFHGSVSEEVRQEAQKKLIDASQWGRLPESELEAKVKEALTEINDPHVTELIETHRSSHHPAIIGEALKHKTINDAAQNQIAQAEQFLQEQIIKAKTEIVDPPPL